MRLKVDVPCGLLLACLLAGAAAGQGAGDAPSEQSRPRGQLGLPRPLPKPDGAVRVATYNTLNLFDHRDDPALEGEHDDIKLAISPERAGNLAAAILATDADVIALEEVESLEAVTWFRDTYLAKGRYEHVASLDAGYFRGVECSVLSRFPITGARVFTDMRLDDVKRPGPGWAPKPPVPAGVDASSQEYLSGAGVRFQRSPLVVEVQVNSRYRLTLLALHHKSGADFDYQREAEALKTVEIVDAIRAKDAKCNLIVLGDFNAAPWDKSLRVYLQAGLIDTLGHRIIPRSIKTPDDEARLYKTHESNRVLDYILLDSGAHRELVVGSPHVYGTLPPPASYDWKTDPFPPGYASDHYPVIVDLMPGDRM